ncbi:MAG: GNAT family N-acetyltransferase [Actinomycetota bacterium]
MPTDQPILARELTDLPDEIRAVPPPPIPEVEAPYGLRVADPDSDDTALITEWMNQPHLAETWEYAWPEQRWGAYLRAQVDGAYSRPLIGEYNDQPMGYLEIYRAARDQIAGSYETHPHDIGMHAAIGELSAVNKGAGARLLPRLIESIWRLDPQCRRIIFEPDYRNTVMRRLSAFGGGIFLGEHWMRPDRKVALYVVPRTPDDLPAYPPPV